MKRFSDIKGSAVMPINPNRLYYTANEAKGYKDIEVYDLQIQGVAQNVIKGL